MIISVQGNAGNDDKCAEKTRLREQDSSVEDGTVGGGEVVEVVVEQVFRNCLPNDPNRKRNRSYYRTPLILLLGNLPLT